MKKINLSKAAEVIAGDLWRVANSRLEVEIHFDPATEGSSGRSPHASEKGPNRKRE